MTDYADQIPQIVDLVRSAATSREAAIVLVESLCVASYRAGIVDGSRQTGDLVNRTCAAMLGAGKPVT